MKMPRKNTGPLHLLKNFLIKILNSSIFENIHTTLMNDKTSFFITEYYEKNDYTALANSPTNSSAYSMQNFKKEYLSNHY